MFSIDDLFFYLKQGREIEFHFNSVPYFSASKHTTNEHGNRLFIIDICKEGEKARKIFEGTLDELVNFKFEDKFTMKDNWNLFRVDYIL